MAALTLTQLKTAYQGAISSTTIGQTFAIRDYILYRIYENTYTSANGVSETLTSFSEVSGATPSASPIAAGCKCITFETSEDFSGTINGMVRQPSRSYTFRANGNDTLPAIAFVVTTGTIYIDKQI